jgi:hypothetical protein
MFIYLAAEADLQGDKKKKKKRILHCSVVVFLQVFDNPVIWPGGKGEFHDAPDDRNTVRTTVNARGVTSRAALYLMKHRVMKMFHDPAALPPDMSFWYPSDRGGLQLNMESRPR